MNAPPLSLHETHDTLLNTHSLAEAEEDGTLHYVGSTYSPDDDTVHDGLLRKGRRIVTFAPILRHKIFPLPEIFQLLLDMGSWGMGTPVEMEFAVNLSVPPGAPAHFGLLQIRPSSSAAKKTSSTWGASMQKASCVRATRLSDMAR